MSASAEDAWEEGELKRRADNASSFIVAKRRLVVTIIYIAIAIAIIASHLLNDIQSFAATSTDTNNFAATDGSLSDELLRIRLGASKTGGGNVRRLQDMLSGDYYAAVASRSHSSLRAPPSQYNNNNKIKKNDNNNTNINNDNDNPQFINTSSNSHENRKLTRDNEGSTHGNTGMHKVFGHSHAHRKNHSLTKPGGVVVRLKEGSSSGLYFLRNGKLRKIPDESTAKYLMGKFNHQKDLIEEDADKLHLSTIIDITPEVFAMLHLDPRPVPALTSGTPDADIEFFKNKIMTLQDPSVITKIISDWPTKRVPMSLVHAGAFHPGMVKLKDHSLDILLSFRGFEGALNEVPYFKWMNFKAGRYLHNVSQDINVVGPSFFNREQIRMVELPLDCYDICPKDTSSIAAIVHLSYAHPVTFNKMFASSMETSNLIVYKNGTIESTTQKQMIMEDRANPYGMEKNWMPFVYNKTPHFVHSLFPLTIVTKNKNGKQLSPNLLSEISDKKPEDIYVMEYVSKEQCSQENNPWEFGRLNGGTQAQLIPIGENEYMGFFHSKFNPGTPWGHWCPNSYFFGAYTFSASPPFKLTRVSKWPIIDPGWYDGEWFTNGASKGTTAYLLYPMGFYFRPHAGGTTWEVVLSMSRNEENGFLVFMDLEELLNSMAPVNCSSA